MLNGVYVNNFGKLGLRNEVTGAQTTTSVAVSTGTWHELSLHAVVGGAAGSHMELSLDGTQVETRTDDLGTTPISRVQIGDSGAKTFSVLFDDVLADAPNATLPPSMSQPPSISGTAQDGQRLTGNPGVWTGAPPPQPAYQWSRCNALGTGCLPIAGATSG
jgi:hypothetical protein